MHILRANINEIELRHLEELVAVGARENSELEFKATLPFQPQRGQPQEVDRWIEQGDRMGDYARDQILSEMVAFANANGGTLVLGINESDDHPRKAVGLSPLPKCEALAQRLLDAAEDIVEPRFLSLVARGVPVDEDANGYVVLRVGRSHAGPHRLNGKVREFYVRRGERAARMDVREIKSLTLELARSGDRVQAMFDSRHREAQERFHALPSPSEDQTPALLIRASAFPTLALEIDSLTSKSEMWWKGGEFKLQFKEGSPYNCTYPAREFSNLPKIRLRSFVDNGEELYRVLRDDGLAEAILAIQPRSKQRGAKDGRLYISWIAGMVVGILAQVEHLRRQIGLDVVEFGLEIEVWSFDPVHLLFDDRGGDGIGRELPNAEPLRFPLYSVRQATTFDDLLNQFMQDLFNAWGSTWQDPCTVDWDKLIRR